MVITKFLIYGKGSASQFVFEVDSFFKPSITQDERELNEQPEDKKVVVIGKIVSGEIKTGDSVNLTLSGKNPLEDTVTEIQSYRVRVSSAITGQDVGIALGNTTLRKLKNFIKPVNQTTA